MPPCTSPRRSPSISPEPRSTSTAGRRRRDSTCASSGSRDRPSGEPRQLSTEERAMVSEDRVQAVERYYASARGTSPALVAAFEAARKEWIADDIEWIEPFGTLHGSETVQREIIQGHTQALQDMRFESVVCFPASDTYVVAHGEAN